MKILFDYQIFTLQRFGGISQYFYEIMDQFYQKKEFDFDFPLFYSNNYYLQSAHFSHHRPFFPNVKFFLKREIVARLNRKNHLLTIETLMKNDFDIFHPTYYDTYFLPYLKDKPYLITIHDMIHEMFPEYFGDNNLVRKNMRELAEKATRIIAISNNTKNDIIKYYHIDASKITVIYHGCSLHESEINCTMHRIKGLPPKYILFIGVRKNYKNFSLLVEAISPLLQHNPEMHLVCAGSTNFSANEIGLLNKFKVQNQVRNIKMKSTQDLISIYKNASLFVYPSIYEGFGIPILEAFSCSCPTILSDSSCFREVAQDAALYFNPFDKTSLVDSVASVIFDDKIRHKLIAKGLDRVKAFSWQKTAEETKKVYEAVYHLRS